MTEATRGPFTSDDLPRETVLAIFRDQETFALRRHTALVGSDGAGTLHILCGCELTFGLDDWGKHLRAVAASSRRLKPKR